MRIVRHSARITTHYLRGFLRQPACVAITLVQPMIWLLLFGALFKRVVEIPGFRGGSYLGFLTPGLVVMTAISSAGWNGMSFVTTWSAACSTAFSSHRCGAAPSTSAASSTNALALVTRQRETLIAAVTSVVLPLTFLSSVFMQQRLAPGWIQAIARFNPVNWAAEASRSVSLGHTDWSLVASRVGLLAVLLVASTALATRAFGAYQRSL